MKVKLFTHTDLDGVGCAIVAKNAFKDVDVEYCDYNEINHKVLAFLENDKPTDYDRIFITDISVNEEVAERLDLIYRGGVSKVQLVDHHATALWLAEKYPMWCEVRVEETNMFKDLDMTLDGKTRDTVLSSGTSLFYKFLRNKNIPKMEKNENLKSFAETVRRYDCWEWFNVYNNDHPKKLNDLLYIIGREKFIDRFSKNPTPKFNELEETILAIEEHRINKYIWYKKKDVKLEFVEIGDKRFKVAYVFAEQNVSLLGNEIAKDYGKYIDFVAIIDVGRNKVSLRGIHDHIALGSDVAKYYGGGGHPKSSGFEFEESLSHDLFKKVFKKED
jgi:oligoribonuclease NrnB/cAMP/cGMP phosphodiesterase (DHH superfamily)